jgi:hypothetical protein
VLLLRMRRGRLLRLVLPRARLRMLLRPDAKPRNVHDASASNYSAGNANNPPLETKLNRCSPANCLHRQLRVHKQVNQVMSLFLFKC